MAGLIDILSGTEKETKAGLLDTFLSVGTANDVGASGINSYADALSGFENLAYADPQRYAMTDNPQVFLDRQSGQYVPAPALSNTDRMLEVGGDLLGPAIAGVGMAAKGGVQGARQLARSLAASSGSGTATRWASDLVPNGNSYDFGHLPDELGGKPIRLFEGDPDVGRQHFLRPERLARLQAAGYDDEMRFVSDVAANYDQVWRQPDGSLMLVKDGDKESISIVGLIPDDTGEFLSVATGMPVRKSKKYPRGGGRELVWDRRPAPPASSTGKTTTFAAQPAKPVEAPERALLGGSAQTSNRISGQVEESNIVQSYLDRSPQYRSAVNNGLLMDEASRMARARDMGFDPRTFYHGTQADIGAFEVGRAAPGNYGAGVYVSRLPEKAGSYAAGEGGAVYPLRIKRGNSLDLTSQDGRALYDAVLADAGSEGLRNELLRRGFDSIRAPGETVVLRPENVRSVHAAFDPARGHEADLLAAFANPAPAMTEEPRR